MKQCRMKLRLSKKGSYITEAAIILPIFIVAVLIMISAVPRMARCERLVFTVCDEMAKENIYAHFFKSSDKVLGTNFLSFRRYYS